MADEAFDGTDMVFYLLGEGQRGAHEARKALPQSIVEPFDMIGFPRLLRDGFVALCHFPNSVGSGQLLVIV